MVVPSAINNSGDAGDGLVEVDGATGSVSRNDGYLKGGGQ